MANTAQASSSVHDPVGENILETVGKADYYNRWIFNLIKPYLQGEIIEIGSGIGNFTRLLSEHHYKITATDYNQIYLTKLKVPTFQFDLTTPSTPRALLNKFDVAICFNVLEHIAVENQALKNIKNTLRPGGKLIILVPAFKFVYGKLDKNLGHVRRYTKTSLYSALMRNGFTVESARYLNPLGLLGWWINSLFKHGTISLWQIKLFELLSRPQLFLEKYLSFPFGLSVMTIAHT